MENYKVDYFLASLEKMKIALSDAQVEQFLKFYETLVEWNKVMNLTGITEFDEVILKHFIDSLSIVDFYDMSNCKTIMDVGTGAGFPGIPLAIAYPEKTFVLIDSLQKRIKFLEEVIQVLGLKNVTALHGRAEDFAGKKEYRETFDLCVSRAVANLSVLNEYCIPFVKKGGTFISYKSGKIEEEVQAAGNSIKILGGSLVNTHKFHLLDTDNARSFVEIKKIKQTARKYPRKSGIPSRQPL